MAVATETISQAGTGIEGLRRWSGDGRMKHCPVDYHKISFQSLLQLNYRWLSYDGLLPRPLMAFDLLSRELQYLDFLVKEIYHTIGFKSSRNISCPHTGAPRL